MIHYNVYPGGTRRIITFSYDDGNINDERLVALFNKYGVKGTFHLNSSRLKKRDEGKEYFRNLYKGHEISCHTYDHIKSEWMTDASMISQVLEDRKYLEEIAEYPVIGMSYPFGTYSKDTIDIMKKCGIVYSRTTRGEKRFRMPDDFMEWHPTCHHDLADEVVDRFIAAFDVYWGDPLLYIWGHSYEFKAEEDWAKMEELLKKLAGHDNVWYATNIEIYNYVTAQKQLQISADEKTFYNPTAIDVWVDVDFGTKICIPAGKIIKL